MGLLFFLWIPALFAQVSPDCVNAIPICNDTPINGGVDGYGDDDFNGASRTGCFKQDSGTVESNSAWYRFRTGASGQLGFNIGFDAEEDWDFALYEASDCTGLGEPVRCNFFDNRNKASFTGVGVDPTGTTDTARYDEWLQVEAGQDYYLLINNFSNNNSGFSIQFSGNIFVTNPYDALDCSIINNLLGPPISACENDNIVLDATTFAAVDYDWFMDTGNGFEPILGENGPTLQATVSAFYRVLVAMPSGVNVISDVQVAFSVVPSTFALSNDAMCSSDDVFDLGLKDTEALGNQNADEYIVSYHASMIDAVNGSQNLPKQYNPGPGLQTIYVRVTSLRNPKCFDASRQFELDVLETPDLIFPEEVYLCQDSSSILIGESISDPKFTYSWDSGENTPMISVSQEGAYTLTAVNVQNGLSCANSRTVQVVISKPPAIADVIIEDLQNRNSVEVLVETSGDFEYQLDNGNFQLSNIFEDVLPGMHAVTVNDLSGCGSVTVEIIVVGFPKFFTPNGDGVNDGWTINGISNLDSPILSIHNRYGKLLYQVAGTASNWDGTFNGRAVPSADYWFRLTYKDENGQRTEAKYINTHFALKR
tara:strand:+ start:187081 stop:188862 length:1782 start_codon:yes stop_codon:yes gene_type:complete